MLSGADKRRWKIMSTERSVHEECCKCDMPIEFHALGASFMTGIVRETAKYVSGHSLLPLQFRVES